MNKVFLFVSIVVAGILISCNEQPEYKPKLNEEQFMKLLTDIHIADGTLTTQNIYRSGENYRPSYYYNSIYKKYNITSEEFDSCVLYYTKYTKRYTAIYDRIIDSLNRLETKYRIELKKKRLEQDTVNLWKRKTHWKIPQDGKPSFEFAIPVKEKGIYTIKASIKRFKDDQTDNPKIKAYFWTADTIGKPAKLFFDPVEIGKEANFKTYETQLEYTDTTYTELRGNLFAGENDIHEFTQRFEIKNIMIFNPQIRPDTTEIDKVELLREMEEPEPLLE